MKKASIALPSLLKALSDPTRLRILALLGATDEVCVCHIHTALGVPQPTASRHLAYLKKAGLVKDRKVGLWVHYRLAVLKDQSLRDVVDAARRAAGRLLTTTTRDCCRLEAAVRTLPSPLQLVENR